MDNLNKKVRDFRNEIGLSQAELSRRSGVAQSTISAIENTDCEPTLTTLTKIAGALNKSLVDFMPQK